MSVLESQAHKKLRSFALFPAKKRQKYEAAYALFAAAVVAHLQAKAYDRAGSCLKEQARIAINKLQRPVESAQHYMEATRAFMLAGRLDDAFECLQLSVSARTKPGVKHKGETELTVQGITVTEGRMVDHQPISPDSHPTSELSTPKKQSPAHLALFKTSAPARSPALTGQAGTIQIEGRGLLLSAETLNAPISTPKVGSRTFNIQPHPETGPSAGLFGASSSASSSTTNSPNHLAPPKQRMRRHSLSGSANSSNITAEGVVHEVLHLDLLLARLAVQLATDLWTDLDFRDGILCLEIASSLFATLLIAERNVGGTFRRRRIVAPLLPVVDPPLIRSESASQPNSPVQTPQKDPSTLAIEERLAGLLGPSAYSAAQSSQTLGAFTLPISSKPIPSLVAPDALGGGESVVVLHTADPHLPVGEGEGWEQSAPTILEESLVCRFQLGKYYCVFDEEMGPEERSVENQELRRAKALFEQIASQNPDEALIHATILPLLSKELDPKHDHSSHIAVDQVATLVSQFSADDDKLHACLFLAGLCDALIGIRQYQASQVRPTPVSTVAKAGKKNLGAAILQANIPPPPIPELYLMTRTVWCPPILLRYREMSASFGNTPEIRLLRACNGLLQLAANLPQRLNDTFGGNAPQAAKQLFQAAWGAEIIREFTEIVAVYNQQRPLTSIVAKLLYQLKSEIKSTISR